MQFSGNFKGKPPILSNFGVRAPLGVKTLLAPPDQNPGSAPGLMRSPEKLGFVVRLLPGQSNDTREPIIKCNAVPALMNTLLMMENVY